MSDIVIKAENLGKRYTIGHQTGRSDQTTFREVLVQNVRNLLSKSQDLISGKPVIAGDTLEEIWALKDVSFEIKRGEAVGIIGRNGAGKSTLLKILSRITEPTTGRVTIKGRVASLLEVGTGFHSELTGRENIYLNGTILGMTRTEIKRKFDEIVAFSEVEQYLDTPVKRYSSGMYVRLAFAVAAHLEPEILVVDEVLAVGDAAFQKKCLGKMENVANAGKTVLFVSHNMTAIKSLCSKAILLSDGHTEGMGNVQELINRYLTFSWQSKYFQSWSSRDSAPGNEYVRVKHIELIPKTKNLTDEITVDTPFRIKFQFWAMTELMLNLSMHVKLINGETVFATVSPIVHIKEGLSTFICEIPDNFLNDGIYSIQMMIVRDSKAIFILNDAVIFEINDVARIGNWWGKWPGVVRPKFHWVYSFNQ